ncbi:type I restriction endonuclease subunit R [Phocaeicola vulgatus]|uniref:type I restriction endonuclease subunit R n=1 Tax=Phocaeicola vulgatus TaxID=821 RepID=UPI001C37E870|nr:HsdR family type I site-specific deoxyribonuclease [Phocaeicola vulgatus]MBV3764358.1 HsdR family type I site-specific deoxyribonuclease [Phocaeicola vulgatus]MBV3768801.1 HsdR family type I site-specific deoxyribonuclease [Phocaeicola vulgatus]MBV3778071.1 HsdR family type I site-specific deoxyribonuclease [Phocaeicola vulgatus]MBV3787089.1 HsdR family type I site-specific deoxyribonuclease [Phocaeicola vulgatus]MBV3791261.1 HsdR family type I site-specific deoxyribonuclease [Phocaeicola v
MKQFSEATRVQMPAMVHLTRIGYTYFGKLSEDKNGTVYDGDTNILLPIFEQQFKKLNPGHEGEYLQVLRDIRKELNDDDLGRGFYNRLKAISPVKLIDFDNIENNTFHFTAEFTCKNGQDEFRPDITLFVNGLPLCFVEVKKPNNHGGMLAESARMNKERFPNKKFRRFINITQLMIFSNNMEYDALGGIVPIQGAFYCTGARTYSPFNCFREENPSGQKIAPYHCDYPYKEIDKAAEKKILSDYNCQVIHTSPEYQTNLDFNTPTNRILTSMCSPERLLYIIRYGIAYVRMEREVDGKIESTDQKHIMRYQQLFASLAIRKKLAEGVKSGVVWHTQGSGKTALSYYLTYILNDFYSKQNKVAKFYFIVDRLDLLEQATQEFEARGLVVSTANTRAELMEQFRSNQAQQGTSGQAEITVVNIQRFAEDKEKVRINDYATNLQRIFILDEAHRGYKPGGCFLANLFEADTDAIKIALTGTPLLKEERASCKVFGTYLHTYYYDKSIADGYTLKIIREDIETSYKERLSDVYDKLDTLVQKKDIRKSEIIEHPSYVNELAHYIMRDLKEFRKIQGDDTLGGMVICETSEQAKQLYDVFQEEWQKYQPKPIKIKLLDGTFVVGEPEVDYKSKYRPLKAGIILHDTDDKETRKQIVKDFKKNMTVDILIVFNMLLTGFDAPRLKRLYFGRKLKDHNLLQAITRVNRPYPGMRYGFVIDFADIKRNFKETNEAYLQELNRFNDVDETGDGNATDTFTQVIEDKDEIVAQMKKVRQTLFDYSYDNAEEFSSEISTEEDKAVLLDLKQALESAKNMANLVRTFGDEDMKEQFAKLEITKLPQLLSEVQRRIGIINQKEAFSIGDETKTLINEAMMDIEFTFSKIGQEEMRLISGGAELKEKWQRTIASFTQNFDQDDPEFMSLRDAFMERFKEHGFVIDSIAKFNEETQALDEIITRLQDLQKRNNALVKKYKGDEKFARVHKRIREVNKQREEKGQKPMFSFLDDEIVAILNIIKEDVDAKVYDRNDILKKDAYFGRTVMALINGCLYHFPQIKPEMDDYKFIQQRISQQYINQYNATYGMA